MVELLCKALLDTELCDRLFADPLATARAFGLAIEEAQALERLDRQAFTVLIMRLGAA